MKNSVLISVVALLSTVLFTSCFTDYRVRGIKDGIVENVDNAIRPKWHVGDTVTLERLNLGSWEIDENSPVKRDTYYVIEYLSGITQDSTTLYVDYKVGVIENVE